MLDLRTLWLAASVRQTKELLLRRQQAPRPLQVLRKHVAFVFSYAIWNPDRASLPTHSERPQRTMPTHSMYFRPKLIRR